MKMLNFITGKGLLLRIISQVLGLSCTKLTHTHTHRQTDRDTHTHTQSERERERERETSKRAKAKCLRNVESV